MVTVHLGREYYAKHYEIYNWLLDHVGNGGSWKKDMPDAWMWDFSEIFGHADIRFRSDEHAALFKLTWL